MQEFCFADYRLMADDSLCGHESMQFLAGFVNEMPFTDTFTLYAGNPALLNGKFSQAAEYPTLCHAREIDVKKTENGWAFTSRIDGSPYSDKYRHVLFCSEDYSEMTLFLRNTLRFGEYSDHYTPSVPFSYCALGAIEAGAVLKGGLPIHASLVEKDGYGVLFLGPSGMGKSTQGRLWSYYLSADFVNGDRPMLRFLDGIWYGYGMPWDGKDGIAKQKKVPIKALVSLEQAKENRIEALDNRQAMAVLFRQAVLPMWDDAATGAAVSMMGRLVQDLPFYHLKNLADEEAAVLTYRTVFGM